VRGEHAIYLSKAYDYLDPDDRKLSLAHSSPRARSHRYICTCMCLHVSSSSGRGGLGGDLSLQGRGHFAIKLACCAWPAD